jgi:hypothetical protein
VEATNPFPSIRGKEIYTEDVDSDFDQKVDV